jgi:hypothetical protein
LTLGGEQSVHVGHPPALTDLEHQGVSGDERVGLGVERAGPEVRDLGVELLGHDRDLRLRQPGDPERLNKFLHPPRRDPEQIAGRHHGGQSAFGAPAPLEQPVRE